MVDRQAIVELVDAKKNLDRASRAIEIYRRMYDSDRSASTVGLSGIVESFDAAHRLFDARVAALSAEERWQLMFTAMITGALEDEFEATQQQV
jgi:outer membrane protein TolC